MSRRFHRSGALRRIATVTFLPFLWMACGGPCGPFPGGRLAGQPFPYPSQGFAAYRKIETVAVELNADRPYSVQTWVIVLDDALYLPADFINPGKRWPFMALENPKARLRIGEEVFEGSLHQVTDPKRIHELRVETGRKYEIEDGSWTSRVEVWWFRFDRRDEGGLKEEGRGSPHNDDNL